MEFRHLQSFTAVVRYGSFTKAAEKTFLSQPTISMHIRQLEEELHVPLIVRTTKSFELTPKGKELYRYALGILELQERIFDRCGQETEHVIHLGASTIPSAYILPEILPAYGRRCPGAHFDIRQGDSREIVEGLLHGLYDVGLIGMPCEEDTLVCEPFCRDRMVLITPPGEPFRSMQGRGLSLARLPDFPFILREEGSGSQKSADRFFERLEEPERPLQVIARINDTEAIKNLVASGLGVSVISERAAGNFAEAGRILLFPLPGGEIMRNLYLVYRRQQPVSKRQAGFIAFVKEHYRDQRPCGEK